MQGMPTTDVCSRTTTLFSNDDTDGKDSFTVVLYFSDWRDVALTVMEFLSRELLISRIFAAFGGKMLVVHLKIISFC